MLKKKYGPNLKSGKLVLWITEQTSMCSSLSSSLVAFTWDCCSFVSLGERWFDGKVVSEVRKRVRFQANTITGCEAAYLVCYHKPCQTVLVLADTQGKRYITVIRREGLRPEELMRHTAKKVGSWKEESFISVHFWRTLAMNNLQLSVTAQRYIG